MSRKLTENKIVILFGLLFCGVYQSYQLNVNPKVEFVEDNENDRVAPKIQGVRVIVDATKMNDGKMEDRTETIRIQTDGAKQTVGIHTDITFEIDEKRNKTKSTDGKNAESDEDDDREVPIYQGTNQENDRSKFDRRFYPNAYHMNNANFHGTNDDESIKYADAGTWVRFLPSASGGWTTERYSVDSLKPKNRGYQSGFVSYGIGQKSFRPCLCANDQPSFRDNSRRSPSAHKTMGVDDKLEYPFSESD